MTVAPLELPVNSSAVWPALVPWFGGWDLDASQHVRASRHRAPRRRARRARGRALRAKRRTHLCSCLIPPTPLRGSDQKVGTKPANFWFCSMHSDEREGPGALAPSQPLSKSKKAPTGTRFLEPSTPGRPLGSKQRRIPTPRPHSSLYSHPPTRFRIAYRATRTLLLQASLLSCPDSPRRSRRWALHVPSVPTSPPPRPPPPRLKGQYPAIPRS